MSKGQRNYQRTVQKKQLSPSMFKRLKEAIKTFGMPKPQEIRPSFAAVLGAVEQNYGIYQTPSFREQVTTLWDDPILKEAITMFSEQVVATGAFLTYNPDYEFKIDGKTAYDVIHEWYDVNDIDGKLLDMFIDLKAFGNEVYRINSQFGMTKVPIEAIWHAIRVDPEIPLQEKYHLQLVPIYGGEILESGTFIHFRMGSTGYHAPFGQGVIYSLLAKPMDSTGIVSPSLYDIRLGMRSSLHEGFRKFSFGNELWTFENLSNEDFERTDDSGLTLSQHIAAMDSTGNRIVTNSKGNISLAVPERTQSYDEFIKQMRDEFFMALADPSLKLGLEQGFTKATSVTASEVYKYKIATMRKVVKEKFEDLFVQILDKMGYEGRKAEITMNFGPEEVAVYDIADIFAAADKNIILRDEARRILSKYHKWDIKGDIVGGDKPTLMQGPTKSPMAGQPARTPQETLMKRQEGMLPNGRPRIVVTPLPDAMARYNGDLTIVYFDPLVPTWMYDVIVEREIFEYNLEFKLGFSYAEAEEISNKFERTTALALGIGWDKYQATSKAVMVEINAREDKPKLPEGCVVHDGGK